MPTINRKYPGKTAVELATAVDSVMEKMARTHGLTYRRDGAGKGGQVGKMGVTGTWTAADGEVVVELKYPMLIPGSVRKEVEGLIEQRLDGLFA